jgi:hypothetical protein
MHELTLEKERLLEFANYLIEHASEIQAPDAPDEYMEISGKDDYIEVRINFFRWMLDVLPQVFPGDWRQDGKNPALWHTGHPLVYSTYVFFGLTSDMFMHLFVALAQVTDEYGGKVLYDDAGPEEVAHNIIELVKRAEK